MASRAAHLAGVFSLFYASRINAQLVYLATSVGRTCIGAWHETSAHGDVRAAPVARVSRGYTGI